MRTRPVLLGLLAAGCASPTAPTPEQPLVGEWVDHGVLIESGLSGFVASDPSVVATDAGGVAMVYTDVDPATDNTVLVWTSSDDPTQVEPGELILAGNAASWDAAIEAAALSPDADTLLYGGYERNGVPADGFPADQGLATRANDGSFRGRG